MRPKAVTCICVKIIRDCSSLLEMSSSNSKCDQTVTYYRHIRTATKMIVTVSLESFPGLRNYFPLMTRAASKALVVSQFESTISRWPTIHPERHNIHGSFVIPQSDS